MKRLSKDGWRTLKIYNPHGLCTASGKGVYVAYHPAQNGRMATYAQWVVIRPGFKTDPNGHWADNYNKTFTVRRREEKEPQRLEAIKWASKQYGIEGEWERDPWGDYHPKGALEAAANRTEVSG